MAQAPRPEGDPAPLPLPCWIRPIDPAARSTSRLDVSLLTPASRQELPAHRLSSGNARDLYWTVSQLVTHHTSNGCNVRPGDIFGTGTISGTTRQPREPAGGLAGGRSRGVAVRRTRRFLEDGDTVVMRAHCRRDGHVPIGFGECLGTVQPAV